MANNKILLIEDEKEMANMYRDVFENAGFDMRLAMSAEEGWEMVQEEEPDMILLDILLPREDGVSFLRRLRRDERLEKTPVVVLSNYDAADTKKQTYDLGIKAYLMKADFTPQSLVKEVEKHIPGQEKD